MTTAARTRPPESDDPGPPTQPRRAAPPASHFCNPLAAVLLAAFAILTPPAAADLRPVAAPVVAIAGDRLLVAVTPESPADLAPPVARLDDSTTVPAELVPVAFIAPPPTRDWVARAPIPVVRTDRRLDGTWLLIVDLPRAAAGQGLWINGNRWDLRWLPDPVRQAAALGINTAADDPSTNPFAGPVDPVHRTDARLRALAEPAGVSPLSRWRWRLLTTGLRPADTMGPPPPGTTPDTDLAARVAADTASRWRRALLTLYEADPATSVAVRRALAGVAVLPPESGTAPPTQPSPTLAPLWWPEQGLLTDILLATSPRQARERAAAWLDTLPPAILNIRDGAAGFAGTGQSTIDVRTRLLMQRDHLVTLRVGRTTELAVAAPGVAVDTVLACRPGERSIAAIGEDFELVRTRVPTLRPTPPGLVLGPLVAEPTMAEWRDDAAAIADTSVRVLLQRSPGPDGRWQVFVRIAEPVGEALPSSTVEVHLGAPGPPAVLTFDAARAAERRSDGWADVAELPVDADQDRVAIAVVRTRPSGARSSWPLPMLPWDGSPGHAPVDLTAWAGRGPR